MGANEHHHDACKRHKKWLHNIVTCFSIKKKQHNNTTFSHAIIPRDTDCRISFDSCRQANCSSFGNITILKLSEEYWADVSSDSAINNKTALACDGSLRVTSLYRVRASIIELGAWNFKSVEIAIDVKRVTIYKISNYGIRLWFDDEKNKKKQILVLSYRLVLFLCLRDTK